MNKKIIPVMFAMAFSIALLAGCGPAAFRGGTEGALQEQAEGALQEATQLEEASGAGAGNNTEDEAPEPGVGDSPETTGDAASEPGEGTDFSAPDIKPVEATLENPARIGEWVETKKYSGEDRQYHTMYYKITGVVRGGEAKKIVEDYNAEGHVVNFKDLDKDDIEYGIVTYETYFPKDFPQADYGITKVTADLNLCNLKDSGTIADYIGLSTVWDISKSPSVNEFYAGDTFKDGRAVFAIVKGFTDYLFNGSYYENDTEVNTYVAGQ